LTVAKTGADADTLETLSDQLDTVEDYVDGIWTDAVSGLSAGTYGCTLAAAGGISTSKEVQHIGNGATTDPLFVVSGSVRLLQFYGVVTAIGAGGVGTDDTMDNLKIELYGTSGVDLTLANSDLTNNGTVGTTILKDAEDSVKMAVLEADAPKIHEGATTKEFVEAILVAENGTVTHLRASYTGDANTDLTIKWVIRWQPLTSASSVVPYVLA
jgi:hypothetical protein